MYYGKTQMCVYFAGTNHVLGIADCDMPSSPTLRAALASSYPMDSFVKGVIKFITNEQNEVEK